MSNLFSGLEKFGIDINEDMSIFDEEEKGKRDTNGKAVPKTVKEEDFLLDKSVKCPICETVFKTKMIKTGRVKRIESDLDLRPRYKELDANKYGVTLCTSCGYAALDRYFTALPSAQEKLVIDKISSKFAASDFNKEMTSYDYEMALERYKMALLTTIVKKGKVSERAYTCLKTAWVIRGKGEHLSKESSDYDVLKADCDKEEEAFLKNALDGFLKATMSENYPMCGMDESTVDYIITVLAMRFKQYELASKTLSGIIISNTANRRMKDRAYDLKEMLIKEMRANKAKK